LPAGTFAQKAELIAFIRALTLGKGKSLNIHTNSKYIFLVLHADATIWKERGLLSGRESPIKHGREILQLLEAIHLPREVAVIYCQGHQRDLTLVTQGKPRQTKRLIKQLYSVWMPCQPPSWFFFSHRSLHILNILLMRKKRLHGGKNIKREIVGMWMVN
jgi:hypothetical protein